MPWVGDGAGASARPDVASQAHCFFCFEVLSCQLQGMPLPSAGSQFPDANCALFVTW